MTGGAQQQGRVDAAVMAAHAQPIHAFGAYRQRGEGAELHFLGAWSSMADAKAGASNTLQHKDTLLVFEDDPRTGRKALHAFKVRQGIAQWRRNAQTGLSERWHPMKLDALFSVPVEAFAPTRPFDAFRDCPVGHDPSLIDMDAMKRAAWADYRRNCAEDDRMVAELERMKGESA